MGRNHLRVLALLKGAEVSLLYDKDPEVTARTADAMGANAATSIEHLVENVDAVIIASPTSTHAGYVQIAGAAVRNVFVEKPLANSPEEARSVAQFAADRGLNLQVGFIERFNPAVEQLKRVLDRSRGVVSIDFVRTNKISARITDVDVVADLMIHDIDLALHINGPIKQISAHGTAPGGCIEFASAVLVHENGRFSRLVASRITERKMRRIQATCHDMFVDCDLLRKEISISRQSEVLQPPGEPYTIVAQEETLEVRPQEALVLELQAFLESCHGASQPEVPGVDDGVASIRVCNEIQREIYSAAGVPHQSSRE
jgi:predicted dehydrogenase